MIRTRQKTRAELIADHRRDMTRSTVARHAAEAAAFDYSTLDSETAKIARSIAERVKTSQRQIGSTMITIGVDLLKIKGRLDHGGFGPWLRAEFNWDERTAQRYMRAAEVFGEKSDTVSALPPTIIHALTATPPAVREEIVRKLDGGERLDPAAIRVEIAEARDKARRERSHSRLTPAEKRRAEAKKGRQAEARSAQEAATMTRAEALEAAARMIVVCFGGAPMNLLALLTTAGELHIVLALREAAERIRSEGSASVPREADQGGDDG